MTRHNNYNNFKNGKNFGANRIWDENFKPSWCQKLCKVNVIVVFFVFAILVSFRFFIIWWIFFLARYDWKDKCIWRHMLQCIIFGKLNGDHPFTYEEALAHESNIHKTFKLNQLLSFVYCLWLFLVNFGFFAFISLVL